MSTLKSNSNLELVQFFNNQVGVRAWNSAKAEFLRELRSEFTKRNIDYSVVSHSSGGFNLSKKVKLVDNKLILA